MLRIAKTGYTMIADFPLDRRRYLRVDGDYSWRTFWSILRRSRNGRSRLADSCTEHYGCMIVSAGRDCDRAMNRLLGELSPTIIALTADRARAAAAAYRSWGEGFHPVSLNYGDCFAYALADEYGCPLLYIGDDFARTDIRSAIER